MKNFNFRVVPWFTDGCSNFLANLFKWLPEALDKRLNVLEFGGGNSTLFFLSKGLRVTTVESDEVYVKALISLVEAAGFKARVYSDLIEFESNAISEDLSIVFAKNLGEIPNIFDQVDFDVIVNDGISRKDVLINILEKKPNAIVVLDNVEYSANWGRLDRSSAKPDLIPVYREFLRSKDWRNYIFEQPEGRGGRGSADKTGWESPHRWISAVAWPVEHLLHALMITHSGFPVVNRMGEDNADLATVSERCPFDWEKMVWLKDPFPPELDLKLDRSFD